MIFEFFKFLEEDLECLKHGTNHYKRQAMQTPMMEMQHAKQLKTKTNNKQTNKQQQQNKANNKQNKQINKQTKNF